MGAPPGTLTSVPDAPPPTFHVIGYGPEPRETLFVDDDNVSGPWDGSPEHPFQHIDRYIFGVMDMERCLVSAREKHIEQVEGPARLLGACLDADERAQRFKSCDITFLPEHVGFGLKKSLCHACIKHPEHPLQVTGHCYKRCYNCSPMDTFGEWLRGQRDALKLTREEFAGRIGCSIAMLRKIEDGERRPSRQIAELIAHSLDIPPEAKVQAVRSFGKLLWLQNDLSVRHYAV